MAIRRNITRVAAIAAASVAFTGLAHAAGTDAGTSVQNTFTLDYEVGGSPQPTITNDPATTIPGANVQGTPTVFTVDRLVDLTVTELTSPITVAPNSSDNVQRFRLTNLGNDNQAYDLTTAVAGGADYTPTNITISYFVDLDGDDTLDPGETLVTYSPGDDTADLAPDQSIVVIVESDVPLAAVDGDSAGIVLTADTLHPVTSLEPGFAGTAGDPVTAGDVTGVDDGVNDLENAAEAVLADGAGSTDAANQGDFSATSVQNVVAATLDAAKSVAVFEDTPASDAACTGLTAPASATEYSIPGACIQYVIEIDNTGSGTAEGLDIADQLPAEVTFLAASLATSGTGFADDPAVTGTGPTLTAPAAGTDCDGSTNCSITLTDAVLAAGGNGQILIWAKVD